MSNAMRLARVATPSLAYLAMAQRLCDGAMRHPTRKTRRYICERGNADDEPQRLHHACTAATMSRAPSFGHESWRSKFDSALRCHPKYENESSFVAEKALW